MHRAELLLNATDSMPPGATGRPRSEARGEQTRTRGTAPLSKHIDDRDDA
jgi:hypothetical protein